MGLSPILALDPRVSAHGDALWYASGFQTVAWGPPVGRKPAYLYGSILKH